MAWNEAETIHLTIKHYKEFCSRIIIYDNYSDDGTPDIARQMGCEVKQFGIAGVLDDREYTKLKNNCWKGSDADWVIVVDADEIFIPPDIWNVDVTIYQTFGWNIYSEKIPVSDWIEITTGVRDDQYSKLVCFNPNQITEIGYIHGCHIARPTGNVNYSNGLFPLLHYRNVGGIDRLIKRHDIYQKRLSDWNIKWKCGHHYSEEVSKKKSYYFTKLQESKPLVNAKEMQYMRM